MAGPGRPRKPLASDDLYIDALTREELAKTAAKRVHDEKRKEAADAFLEAEMERLRNADDPNEADVRIMIDLPGHSTHIRYNNMVYHHGRVYDVKVRVADTLNEIIERAWDHEDHVNGANRKAYQPPSITHLAAQGAQHAGGSGAASGRRQGARW